MDARIAYQKVQLVDEGGDLVTIVEVPPIPLTPSTNLELPAPVAATAGTRVKYYVTPSADITLTMAEDILIPSDSAFTSKALTSGKTYIVQLESNGTAWMLTTLVGGY